MPMVNEFNEMYRLNSTERESESESSLIDWENKGA